MSDDCIYWDGKKDKDGYGILSSGKRAHRLSYENAKGPIPDGLLVRHTCDNSGCINPDHLILGTQADNVADMVERGRIARGERQWKSYFSEDHIHEIRRLRVEDALSFEEIAGLFGSTRQTIWRIVHGKTWAHIH